MSKSYFTLMKRAEASFEEKRSVFICSIGPVSNEEEAHDFIREIKEKYKDASHNVYAYITNNGISMRYSDDGEPQGTAGPPVLEVLKRENLNDVVSVVTRYFGGTLLGAGGLIRAYGSACKLGIDKANKVKKISGVVFTIKCSYELYGKLENYLRNKNIIILGVDYTDKVLIKVKGLKDDYNSIENDLIEMACGEKIISEIKDEMVFVDNDGMVMEV